MTALAFVEFARTWRLTHGLALFGLIAVLVYTRQLYTIVWVALVVALLLAFGRAHASVIVRAAAVPLVLVAALYVKNEVMFGVPSTSSWFGANLARITLNVAPRDQLEQLVREGKLSRVALVTPFADVKAYRGLLPLPGRRGIPVLDEEYKAGGAAGT